MKARFTGKIRGSILKIRCLCFRAAASFWSRVPPLLSFGLLSSIMFLHFFPPPLSQQDSRQYVWSLCLGLFDCTSFSLVLSLSYSRAFSSLPSVKQAEVFIINHFLDSGRNRFKRRVGSDEIEHIDCVVFVKIIDFFLINNCLFTRPANIEKLLF